MSTAVEEDVSHAFLRDPPSEMTYGRRLALWLNANFAGFYGPAPDPNAPSLEKAWAFYEHVTLQRHIVEETDREPPKRTNVFRQGDRKLTIAEPGETDYPTKLYPIFSTPLSQLGDFGLGFGIYFATVRDFAVLTFLCGLLSIPNIAYFASYSGDQKEGVPTLLKGSAICTNRSWVPCPSCTPDQFNSTQKGAYEVKRFHQAWTVAPSDSGFYLNVTDYLVWEYNSSEGLERTELGVVRLDLLKNVSIPAEYEIVLSPTEGYWLHGENVTDQLDPKHTPLWCGYDGPADCYLDLYPFFDTKHDEDMTIDTFLAPRELPGDTDFYQVSFALKNLCDGAKINQGYINWGTLLVMIVGSFFIRARNDQIETTFDEDEQTAQDYSVVVKNPPPDAWDPEEWKRFFEGALAAVAGGESEKNSVRVCTVDVDNERVIQLLVERREILRHIEMALPPETPLDNNSLEREVEKAKAKDSCMGSKVPPLVQKLKDIEKDIRTFLAAVRKPPTTKIYITFETEAAQRMVLSKMSVATYEARHNIRSSVSQPFLFRGEHVLRVREAHEPNTIRWLDLDASRQSMMVRKFITTIVTLVSMLVAYYCIRAIYKKNQPFWAGIVTTIFTAAFPMVALTLMKMEKHHSETSMQAWLFAKIALFNIFVTTVLLSLITPFEATLDKKEASTPGLLPAVYGLFFSQLVFTPALQLLDIGGNIKRHIMAPRAETQAEMNLMMKGTPVHLAVRYGNLMKFLYLTLWYCSIYPATYFLGAFALIICYFVDRFSLMRSWARSPHVGAEISYFARKYFTPVAICLMSVMSAYFWSGFPYDNLCLEENATLPSYYVDDFEINLEADVDSFDLFESSFSLYTGQAVEAEVNVTKDSEAFKYCNQDIRSYAGLSFPALPQWQPEGGEWMTDEQEEITSVHGWSSLIVTIVIVISIGTVIVQSLYRFYSRTYTPRGKDQKIDFSDVPTISSYIPQVSSELIAYPLVLCPTKDLDPHLFDWQDPDKPYSYYDITNDVAAILGNNGYPDVFARVKHWDGVGKEAEEHATVREPEPEGIEVVSPPDITGNIEDVFVEDEQVGSPSDSTGRMEDAFTESGEEKEVEDEQAVSLSDSIGNMEEFFSLPLVEDEQMAPPSEPTGHVNQYETKVEEQAVGSKPEQDGTEEVSPHDTTKSDVEDTFADNLCVDLSSRHRPLPN